MQKQLIKEATNIIYNQGEQVARQEGNTQNRQQGPPQQRQDQRQKQMAPQQNQQNRAATGPGTHQQTPKPSEPQMSLQQEVRNVLWGGNPEATQHRQPPQQQQAPRQQQPMKQQPRDPNQQSQAQRNPQPRPQGMPDAQTLLRENIELRQQLQDYRSKYQQLVEQFVSYEQVKENLRDLAIQYERLEAQRNTLCSVVQELQNNNNQAHELKASNTKYQLELREYKERQIMYEETLNEKDQEINQMKEYLHGLTEQHNMLIDEREKLIEESERAHQFIEEEHKRIFSYQSYTDNITNENKQLVALTEQLKTEREELLSELNRRITDDKTANTYEVDRLNSLLRIKENQIAQLMARVNSDATISAAGQEAEYKAASLEKRAELLEQEIEKYSTALMNKNKEIYELKALNFELDKMSKNSLELKSAQFQVQKLTQLLAARTSDYADLKASNQMLQKKLNLLEGAARDNEASRISSTEMQSLRQALHSKELQLARLKQTLSNKDNGYLELQTDRDQSKKRINNLQIQIENEREENRSKISQLEQKQIEIEKKHRAVEKDLRDKLSQMEAERYSQKSTEHDRQDRIKFLETQLAETVRLLEHERTEYFSMRKSYEDKIYSIEGARTELQSRLGHSEYDIELKDKEVVRLQGQIRSLNADLSQLRAQNLNNINIANDLKVQCQRMANEIENRKAEFEDAMRRVNKDCQAYQQTIRVQEIRMEQLQQQSSIVRKSPIRESRMREQQAVQRQLHQLQLQVQHFQQLQLDQNKMNDLDKEVLIQQHTIDTLQKQLEEKKLQEQQKLREFEQTKLKMEATIIDLQKQFQSEQHHHNQFKRNVENQRIHSEHSRVVSQVVTQQRPVQQSTQTPARQHEIINTEVSRVTRQDRKPVVMTHKRTDLFLEMRQENESLKQKVNSFSARLAEYDGLVQQLSQAHHRLSGFNKRMDNLLRQESKSGSPRTDLGLKSFVSEVNSKIKRLRQENEQIKAGKIQFDKVQVLVQGNPLEQMCQQLLEENDVLRSLCDEYDGRIKQYQNELLKLAHSPPSQTFRPLLANPFDIRNTIRGLEEKVEYFRSKNIEQEERVQQLLKVNGELKGQLETIRSKSSDKDGDFYRQQLDFSQRNLSTVQQKLKQSLQQLSYVRNVQLAKAIQSNTELSGKLSQQQAIIFDLTLKINTSQTERAYAEEQRKQLLSRLEAANLDVKRNKAVEKEQYSVVDSLTKQHQDAQVQRNLLISKIDQLNMEVNKLSIANNELQIALSLKTEEKRQMEMELAKNNETVQSLSQQLSTIRGELIRTEAVMNEADSIVYYIDRAKATITDLETQLPELRNLSNPMLSYSLTEAINKTSSIFKEIEHSKANLQDSRRALQKKSNMVLVM